ncbi:MAG: tRNA lysidine(34) synthetase TilS [Methylobacterium sp.]|nr:tRNA lysidine(34) synthetase TilS [Methylobacterium sp.]MCA3607029.1 tRNA lysidine(34) synthetase TilS [Methylobacterium sp.]MCA3610173.1 tRNA lysidine(34) synthetase TilS [Methylobacterium sp.]MCA3611868.1 tRNA lysidine(34) synthetase TilS [Methylobacterium sp.]MCA3617802.1 tRNA lysidine(34) synthetase TilS [Methylobacterium sp.]
MLRMLPDKSEEHPSDSLPLTPEEALALFLGALGNDETKGLLLAVSGGPDSIAMLCLAAAIRAYLPPLAVATVDHRLRPEAAEEAKMVAGLCKELKIPHCTLPWADRPKAPFSQEAARKGRYALLLGHARAIEASHVVTAHTLDDQAETVLMRMASGSGIGGLGAMRPNVKRGHLGHLRPFLDVPKSRVLATCDLHGWHFAQDASNGDERFKRVRLRALMPILAQEGLTPERLGTLAARARRTEDAIDHVVKRMLNECLIRHAPDGGAVLLRSGPFYTEPFEIAMRMLRRSMFAIASSENMDAQIPLAKLEMLMRNLRMAIRDQRPFRSTLAWAVVAHANTLIEVRSAPPRRESNKGNAMQSRDALASAPGVSK